MKKWIMNKLGIVNHAKEGMKIGEMVGEGLREGINKHTWTKETESISDQRLYKRIRTLAINTGTSTEEIMDTIDIMVKEIGLTKAETLIVIENGLDAGLLDVSQLNVLEHWSPGESMSAKETIDRILDNNQWKKTLDKTDMSTMSSQVDHTNWGKSISASSDSIQDAIQSIKMAKKINAVNDSHETRERVAIYLEHALGILERGGQGDL